MLAKFFYPSLVFLYLMGIELVFILVFEMKNSLKLLQSKNQELMILFMIDSNLQTIDFVIIFFHAYLVIS